MLQQSGALCSFNFCLTHAICPILCTFYRKKLTTAPCVWLSKYWPAYHIGPVCVTRIFTFTREQTNYYCHFECNLGLKLFFIIIIIFIRLSLGTTTKKNHRHYYYIHHNTPSTFIVQLKSVRRLSKQHWVRGWNLYRTLRAILVCDTSDSFSSSDMKWSNSDRI